MATTTMIPPPPGYQCPLGDEYLGLLNQAIELFSHYQYDLQQAGMCGLPVERMQADCERGLGMLRAIKTHFFPNCP